MKALDAAVRVRRILDSRPRHSLRLGLVGAALVLALGLFLIPQGRAEQSAAPGAMPAQPAAKPPIWFTLLPMTPMRTIRDYENVYLGRALDETTLSVTPLALEIRSGDGKRRLGLLPDAGEGMIPQVGTGRIALTPDQVRLIGNLPDGEYLVAMNMDQVRCSNVARFRLDSTYDSKVEPVLKLTPLPLGPGQTLPFLGLTATGPDPADPKLRYSSMAFPTLVVDGVERKPNVMKWVGPDGSIPTGMRSQRVIDLGNYTPAIAPKAQHEVVAKILGYESAAVTVPAADELGAAWDKATAEASEPPAQAALLRGTVTGPDGRPAAGYDVWLVREELRLQGTCDAAGRYQFANVPPGQYALAANPPAAGQPALRVENVTVEAGTTNVRDLSLERKFTFSGKVTYGDDGTPAVGWTVHGSWTSPDRTARFTDSAVTDDDGRYTLGAPYEVAAFVGSGGEPAKRRVAAGETDVDFVAERPWGAEAGGVQATLAADKVSWKAGEAPTLKAGVRNTGSAEVSVIRSQEGCNLEFDGKWFEQNQTDAKASPLAPGQRYDGIPIVLDDRWVSAAGEGHLRLAPGEHRVRIAFVISAPPTGPAMPGVVVSNLVTITILPAEPPPAAGPLKAEENAQPRTFNSAVAFNVYAVVDEWDTLELVGRTPSEKPLTIPPCRWWCTLSR